MALHSKLMPKTVKTHSISSVIGRNEHLSDISIVLRVRLGSSVGNLIATKAGNFSFNPWSLSNRVTPNVRFTKVVSHGRLVGLSLDGHLYEITNYDEFNAFEFAHKVVDIAIGSKFLVALTSESRVVAFSLENICKPIVEETLPVKSVKVVVFEALIYILGTDERLYRWNPVIMQLEVLNVFGKQVRDVAATLFELVVLTTDRELYVLDFTGRPLAAVPVNVPNKAAQVQIDRLVDAQTKVLAIGCDDYIYPLERLVENYVPQNKISPQKYLKRVRSRMRCPRPELYVLTGSRMEFKLDDSEPNEIFRNLLGQSFRSVENTFENEIKKIARPMRKCLRYELRDSKLKSLDMAELFLTDPDLLLATTPFAMVVNCNSVIDRLLRLSPSERATLRGTPYEFLVDTFKAVNEPGKMVEWLIAQHSTQMPPIVEKLAMIFEQMNGFLAKHEGPMACHDIVLEVKENDTGTTEKFYGCRAYLELVSPHLKKVFEHWGDRGMKGPVTFTGHLVENRFAHAFRLYLEFLHTGWVDVSISDTYLTRLIDIGRCYLDQTLVNRCIDILIINLTSLEQCEELYSLAEFFDLPMLKKRVDSFVEYCHSKSE